jgi:hypothetical protein
VSKEADARPPAETRCPGSGGPQQVANPVGATILFSLMFYRSVFEDIAEADSNTTRRSLSVARQLPSASSALAS